MMDSNERDYDVWAKWLSEQKPILSAFDTCLWSTPFPSVPTIYDITTEQMRPVTQVDLDHRDRRLTEQLLLIANLRDLIAGLRGEIEELKGQKFNWPVMVEAQRHINIAYSKPFHECDAAEDTKIDRIWDAVKAASAR